MLSSNKKTSISLPLLIVTSLLAALSWQEGVCQPKLKVMGGEHFNLGTVYAGDMVSFKGTIVNAGDQNLFIERLNASCGCTKPEVGSHLLHPGDSTILAVQYDSRRAPAGHVEKSVDIVSNDFGRHTIKVGIGVDIIADLIASPEVIDFGKVETDSICIGSVVLTNKQRDTIRIGGITDKSHKVQASIERNILAPGASTRMAALLRIAKPGSYSGTIAVETVEPERRITRIKYAIRVVGKKQIAPRRKARRSGTSR